MSRTCLLDLHHVQSQTDGRVGGLVGFKMGNETTHAPAQPSRSIAAAHAMVEQATRIDQKSKTSAGRGERPVPRVSSRGNCSFVANSEAVALLVKCIMALRQRYLLLGASFRRPHCCRDGKRGLLLLAWVIDQTRLPTKVYKALN
jgi:hypothetical protein